MKTEGKLDDPSHFGLGDFGEDGADWIQCVLVEGTKQTYCGAAVGFFQSIQHAVQSVENGSRMLPCPECMVKAYLELQASYEADARSEGPSEDDIKAKIRKKKQDALKSVAKRLEAEDSVKF